MYTSLSLCICMYVYIYIYIYICILTQGRGAVAVFSSYVCQLVRLLACLPTCLLVCLLDCLLVGVFVLFVCLFDSVLFVWFGLLCLSGFPNQVRRLSQLVNGYDTLPLRQLLNRPRFNSAYGDFTTIAPAIISENNWMV